MSVVYTARKLLIALSALAGLTASVQAAELKISYAAGSPSVDPHYSLTPPFRPLRRAVYECLIELDNDGKPEGKIAESWRIVDDVTWEFKIRKGVKFSDGTPLVAEDIPFSFARTAEVSNGPGPITQYLRMIKTTTVVDADTVRIVTHRPAPLLLNDLSQLPIGSKKILQGVKPTEIGDGTKAADKAIGTGPYRVLSFTTNDTVVLAPSAHYWGPKPIWDKVTMLVQPQSSTRLASLLAGDVDAIDAVAFTDVPRVKSDARFSTFSYPTGGLVWLTLPRTDDSLKSGTITDLEGKPLDRNPMSDPRVREAMTLAINVEGINQRIFDGYGISSGQYVRSSHPAAIPEVKGWKFDDARAQKLMEESGWANKFKVVIVASAQNPPEAGRLIEAVAQNWAKIGVKAEVQSVPAAVYAQRRANATMAVIASFWLIGTFDAELYLVPLLHSFDKNTGYGAFNSSFYLNPEVDRLTDALMQEQDEKKRMPMLTQAMRLALEDRAILPLMHLSNALATKKGINIAPRTTGFGILVQDVKPN